MLITAPQLIALSEKLVTWTGVSNQTYTVQSSYNLLQWAVEGSVFSPNSQFVFTNTSSASPRFFRVAYP